MVGHVPRSRSTSNNKKRDPIAPRAPTFKKKSSASIRNHGSFPELMYHCCHSTGNPMTICMREHNEDHISATHPMNAFTDGSFIHSKFNKHRAGYAVYLHGHHELSKNVRSDSKISYVLNQSLPEFQIDLSTHKLSSMIMELLAILEAIVHVQSWWEKPSIYIYTDSLSSLKLLWRFSNDRKSLRKHALVEFLARIHQAACDSRVKVHLLKVKAHARIHGNEAADRLAYAAANARPWESFASWPKDGWSESFMANAPSVESFPVSSEAPSFELYGGAVSGAPREAGVCRNSTSYSSGARETFSGSYEAAGRCSAQGFVSGAPDDDGGLSRQKTPPASRSPSYASPAKVAANLFNAASLQKMLESMTRALQEGAPSMPAKTPGAKDDLASCVRDLFETVASVDSARNQAAAAANRFPVGQHEACRVSPQQKLAEKFDKNDVEPIYISEDEDFIFISDDDDEDDRDDDLLFINHGGKFVEYIILDDDEVGAPRAGRKTTITTVI